MQLCGRSAFPVYARRYLYSRCLCRPGETDPGGPDPGGPDPGGPDPGGPNPGGPDPEGPDPEESEPEPCSVFPNPVDQRIYLNGLIEAYELYSIHGMAIRKGQSEVIDVSDLQPGIYVLLIHFSNHSESFKVLVN